MPNTVLENALARIDALEMHSSFLEDHIEGLNQELSALSQEFLLAKQAIQHLYKRMEQMQTSQAEIKDSSDEAPPPHY